jgi:hypothetical protein
MATLCIRAFTRKGFKDIQPRANVKTYDLWIAAGYRVKPGEHAVKVKNLRLFHSSQVVKIDSKEQAKILAEKAVQKAKRQAKSQAEQHQPQA